MNASTQLPPVLRAYRFAERLPLGRRLFTAAFQRMAPYFRSIPVSIDTVEPGTAVVRMADRRRVRNHLGTVHAIALCNLAELTMGLVIEATLPRSHRWIPKGMQVQYLAKASGDMTATGTLHLPEVLPERGEMTVPVEVRDPSGKIVFHADILLWVTARKSA